MDKTAVYRDVVPTHHCRSFRGAEAPTPSDFLPITRRELLRDDRIPLSRDDYPRKEREGYSSLNEDTLHVAYQPDRSTVGLFIDLHAEIGYAPVTRGRGKKVRESPCETKCKPVASLSFVEMKAQPADRLDSECSSYPQAGNFA